MQHLSGGLKTSTTENKSILSMKYAKTIGVNSVNYFPLQWNSLPKKGHYL